MSLIRTSKMKPNEFVRLVDTRNVSDIRAFISYNRERDINGVFVDYTLDDQRYRLYYDWGELWNWDRGSLFRGKGSTEYTICRFIQWGKDVIEMYGNHATPKMVHTHQITWEI